MERAEISFKNLAFSVLRENHSSTKDWRTNIAAEVRVCTFLNSFEFLFSHFSKLKLKSSPTGGCACSRIPSRRWRWGRWSGPARCAPPLGRRQSWTLRTPWCCLWLWTQAVSVEGRKQERWRRAEVTHTQCFLPWCRGPSSASGMKGPTPRPLPGWWGGPWPPGSPAATQHLWILFSLWQNSVYGILQQSCNEPLQKFRFLEMCIYFY